MGSTLLFEVKAGIATKASNSGIAFRSPADAVVAKYCETNSKLSTSLCLDHYKLLWNSCNSEAPITFHRCPYGLVTSSVVGTQETGRVFFGLWNSNLGDCGLQPPITQSAAEAKRDLDAFLPIIEQVAAEVRQEELDHFEAALHDARHLNHAITQNAEALMGSLGFGPDEEWDMREIASNDQARRALTVFAASRDLSTAMLMHEISRNPAQAREAPIPTHIHKLFFRQLRISSERMAQTRLSYFLGSTNRALQLSPAFKVIPKILIDNAIKYSQRGSEIRLLFLEGSQFFKIQCSNKGPIVRESEIESLFKRGARGSNRTGIPGQGIGLWLAKEIVQANSGIIGMSVSEEGKEFSVRRLGTTTVTISLLASTT